MEENYENIYMCEEILKKIKKKDSMLIINLKNNKQGFCFLCKIPYIYRYYDVQQQQNQ